MARLAAGRGWRAGRREEGGLDLPCWRLEAAFERERRERGTNERVAGSRPTRRARLCVARAAHLRAHFSPFLSLSLLSLLSHTAFETFIFTHAIQPVHPATHTTALAIQRDGQ